MKTPRRDLKSPGDSYHHGDLRAALLQAAGDLIRESGVEALTLRACARRAGVSHGAPAHHFGNLTGLLTEFAVQGFERLGASMDPTTVEGAKDALQAAGLGYVRFAMDAPDQFRLMWRTDLLDEKSERLDAARHAAEQPIRSALKSAYEKSHHAPPTREILDQRFLIARCFVHGYACLWVEGDRKSRSLTELKKLLDGVRPALLF
jgi:AcrR family transcriptional regulator